MAAEARADFSICVPMSSAASLPMFSSVSALSWYRASSCFRRTEPNFCVSFCLPARLAVA